MWRPLVALHRRKSRRANVPERGGLYGLVPVVSTPTQPIAMLWRLCGNRRLAVANFRRRALISVWHPWRGAIFY